MPHNSTHDTIMSDLDDGEGAFIVLTLKIGFAV